jgi:hypothetical protein
VNSQGRSASLSCLRLAERILERRARRRIETSLSRHKLESNISLLARPRLTPEEPRRGPKSEFGSLPIPKGLRLKAQGCEARATLGKRRKKQPQRGCDQRPKAETPLGFCLFDPLPQVARASQPWALLRNPVGIQGKDTF